MIDSTSLQCRLISNQIMFENMQIQWYQNTWMAHYNIVKVSQQLSMFTFNCNVFIFLCAKWFANIKLSAAPKLHWPKNSDAWIFHFIGNSIQIAYSVWELFDQWNIYGLCFLYIIFYLFFFFWIIRKGKTNKKKKKQLVYKLMSCTPNQRQYSQ